VEKNKTREMMKSLLIFIVLSLSACKMSYKLNCLEIYQSSDSDLYILESGKYFYSHKYGYNEDVSFGRYVFSGDSIILNSIYPDGKIGVNIIEEKVIDEYNSLTINVYDKFGNELKILENILINDSLYLIQSQSFIELPVNFKVKTLELISSDTNLKFQTVKVNNDLANFFDLKLEFDSEYLNRSSEINVSFLRCDSISVIDNSSFYNFNSKHKVNSMDSLFNKFAQDTIIDFKNTRYVNVLNDYIVRYLKVED
jgi:hypothetical protein